MSADSSPVGVVGVATGGIQDVSALLPLLGTDQCEGLVTSALQEGLLYAAATPMSIFGSLGIVKAGFVVLWTSVDTSYFSGPTLLRNAGFRPSGVGSLLSHVAESSRNLYAAEDKLRRILARKRIRSVTINLFSRDLMLWNLRLVGATIFLSSLGLLPYVFIIVWYLSDRPFQDTWLYPFIRIVGCDLITLTIQFIFQIRILEESYYRIRFAATDDYMKDHGLSLPPFWDANERSKTILSRLRRYVTNASPPEASPSASPIVNESKIDPDLSRLSKGSRISPATPTQDIIQGLGAISSFSFPAFGEIEENFASFPKDLPQSSPRASDSDIAEKGVIPPEKEVSPQIRSSYHSPHLVGNFITSFLLFTAQITLVFGVVLAVIGYIGCFSVVQAAPRPDSKGPLVWLVCEALLAVIRTLVWAWNPAWDDPKSPIALEKVVSRTSNQRSAKKPSTYGIGWMLDSVTADDMHALVVGINEYNHPDLTDMIGAVPDAKRIASYLQDVLLVPSNQIVSLYDSDATKERIIEELRALADKNSVKDGAPILIYFAGHTFESRERVYIAPHQIGDPWARGDDESPLKDTSISYDTIVDLLRRIARERTDNVTLVLDACDAGSMGKNKKFDATRGGIEMGGGDRDMMPQVDYESVNDDVVMGVKEESKDILIGHASHILIAGTAVGAKAYEHGGEGLFTQSLIDALSNSNHNLQHMSYRMLVDQINLKLKHQKALCTSIYQNRLLFNGLFSRRIADDGVLPVITVQYSDPDDSN